jgi:hypothetical protein
MTIWPAPRTVSKSRAPRVLEKYSGEWSVVFSGKWQRKTLPCQSFARQHSGHKPRTTLLILFELISLAFLARLSWPRQGTKLLFWGLIAMIAMIAAIYVLMFRDVPLRPL